MLKYLFNLTTQSFYKICDDNCISIVAQIAEISWETQREDNFLKHFKKSIHKIFCKNLRNYLSQIDLILDLGYFMDCNEEAYSVTEFIKKLLKKMTFTWWLNPKYFCFFLNLVSLVVINFQHTKSKI